MKQAVLNDWRSAQDIRPFILADALYDGIVALAPSAFFRFTVAAGVVALSDILDVSRAQALDFHVGAQPIYYRYDGQTISTIGHRAAANALVTIVGRANIEQLVFKAVSTQSTITAQIAGGTSSGTQPLTRDNQAVYLAGA